MVETWENAILQAYLAAGGCADNQKIYRIVGNFITLTPAHKQATRHGGRPAYEHEVRSYIANLKEAGYLERVSRGRYCLTDMGRQRVSGEAATAPR